jgi:hypothetical protein
LKRIIELTASFVIGAAFGIILDANMAHADEAAKCMALAPMKAKVEGAPGGKWITVTPEQYNFLRGVYAMDPQTPPGLPYGDSAVLAKADNHNPTIFFVDGDKVCTPMTAPPELLGMLNDVAEGKVTHEGDGT